MNTYGAEDIHDILFEISIPSLRLLVLSNTDHDAKYSLSLAPPRNGQKNCSIAYAL